MHRNFASLFLVCALLSLAPPAAAAVTIQWSAVGDAGNANDTSGFGAVPYAYNIGTKDVTASQYVEFLNAKDAGGLNALSLYNSNMSDATFGGISFTAGNPSGSKYGVIGVRGQHPANYTSWYDSIRFANWLHNGQGSGDTETGAYTLGTLGAGGVPIAPPLTHNGGAQVWLPTENEWYKAAYYDPRTTAQGGPPLDSHYWLYGTSSSSPPIASGPTALVNHANYNLFVGNLTDVGAYTGTTSPYGAFDMGGDVRQWNEDLDGSSRIVRGGAFNSFDPFVQSSFRLKSATMAEATIIGFRVASVPEPGTAVLAVIACGLMCLLHRKRFIPPHSAR